MMRGFVGLCMMFWFSILGFQPTSLFFSILNFIQYLRLLSSARHMMQLKDGWNYPSECIGKISFLLSLLCFIVIVH